MGESRRKRKRAAAAVAVNELIDRQRLDKSSAPPPLIRQDDIPPHLDVCATMQAAWEELAQRFFAELPKKQREDAKFIFYTGVQSAANLMIYCAGQGCFEVAADQITQDCMQYEKEAEAVLAERKRLIEEPFAGTG